jgi:hypothetical protein
LRQRRLTGAEARGRVGEDVAALVARGERCAVVDQPDHLPQDVVSLAIRHAADEYQLRVPQTEMKADGVGETDVIDRVRTEFRLLERVLWVGTAPYVLGVKAVLANVGQDLLVTGIGRPREPPAEHRPRLDSASRGVASRLRQFRQGPVRILFGRQNARPGGWLYGGRGNDRLRGSGGEAALLVAGAALPNGDSIQPCP